MFHNSQIEAIDSSKDPIPRYRDCASGSQAKYVSRGTMRELVRNLSLTSLASPRDRGISVLWYAVNRCRPGTLNTSAMPRQYDV